MKDSPSSSSPSPPSTSCPSILALIVFFGMVVPVYITIRFILANKMPIMDCDEVYNYWEPLHFLLYGTGLQTWEYAHEFALRTYAYLLPLKYVAQYIYQPILRRYPFEMYFVSQYLTVDGMPASTDKVLLFLLLRSSVATTTAIAELTWIYTLLSKRSVRQGSEKSFIVVSLSTVFWTTVLMLTAAGMNHSAGAFLPSTTWMMSWCWCASLFVYQQHALFAVVAILSTLTVGWPFGCVCVIPMALHILHKEYTKKGIANLFRYFLFLLIVSVGLQYIVMHYVDEQYYGIPYISPTYNIFKYNAAGNGDELYGVEPISYYIKNLTLNFNVLALLGVITVPVVLYQYYWINYPAMATSASMTTSPTPKQALDYDIITILLSLPIWLLITVPRPHKEERFLFPIYPVLIFGAVITLQLIAQYYVKKQQEQSSSLQQGQRFSLFRWGWKLLFLHSQIVPLLVFGPCIVISIFRTMALNKYYTSPLIAYNRVAHQPIPTTQVIRKRFDHMNVDLTNMKNYVCTCGEWYRFPSSFYLPSDTQLGFLPSSFKGQLPQPFTQFGSLPASQNHLQPFNDMNRHQPERYVNETTMKVDCKWYVVLQSEDENTYCGWPFLYGKARVSYTPFLNSATTKSALHRILYIPSYHEEARQNQVVDYDDYVIYQEYDDMGVQRLKRYDWEQRKSTGSATRKNDEL